MNYKQMYVIDQKNREKWLKINPELNENSGIYILTREESDFKYAYIGQAKHILTRLAQHLRGYLHIDLSLKKHGLYDKNTNPLGWGVDFEEFPESELDYREQQYILKYARLGFQLRNKTTGSQSDTKRSLDGNREVGGYRRGVRQGYAKAIKELNEFLNKYIDYSIKGKPNKTKERKLKEFKTFLQGEKLN